MHLLGRKNKMSRKYLLRKLLGNVNVLNYNPKKFWEDRAENYVKEPVLDGGLEAGSKLVDFVNEFGIKSLFEVGVGWGQNLKAVLDRCPGIEKLAGCDISHTMLSKAKEYLGNGASRVELFEADARKGLRFPNNSFDCVLSAGVLMHVPPESIEFVASELKRVARKWVFLSEENRRYKYGLRHSNNFVFYHDYNCLFNDFRLLFCKEFKQKIFVHAFEKQEEF